MKIRFKTFAKFNVNTAYLLAQLRTEDSGYDDMSDNTAAVVGVVGGEMRVYTPKLYESHRCGSRDVGNPSHARETLHPRAQRYGTKSFSSGLATWVGVAGDRYTLISSTKAEQVWEYEGGLLFFKDNLLPRVLKGVNYSVLSVGDERWSFEGKDALKKYLARCGEDWEEKERAKPKPTPLDQRAEAFKIYPVS